MKLQWNKWLYGLGSGVVGGVASGGSAWLGLAVGKAAGMEVHTLNWKELGLVCLTSGLMSAFFYLKQSPLPPDEDNKEKETR